jgi:hypothetical protein
VGLHSLPAKKGNPLSLAEGVAGATALTMANSMFE